jgi:hypothetical protein
LSFFAIKKSIAQLPTVYFNHIYNITFSQNNRILIGSRISGRNFKFVGSIAATNGGFQAESGVVNGTFIYTNQNGSNVIYTGYLDLRGPSSGGNIWGFVFERTGGGTEKFFITVPRFETNVIIGNEISLNSGSGVDVDLNLMRNQQVVLTTNYFVTNFSTCPNAPSTAQTFTISGSNLSTATAAVTVTAPTNFEVSKEQSANYAGSISFTATNSILVASTVYLRLKNIQSVGTYSGTVIVSTPNAASQDLFASGDVNSTTAISAQPISSTICSGTATTFSVAGSGASLTYQWQVLSTAPGAVFTNLSNTGIYTGSTTSVLRLSTGVTDSYTGFRYRCVVTGSCGLPVTSSEATLTVNSPISISSSPTDATICASNNTSFSVIASGLSPTYQWQLSTNSGADYTDISNGGIYSNAGTATLTITGTTGTSSTTAAMTGYRYRCVVTGSCANATSDAATLTVNTAPNTPGSITGNTTICSNTNQSYSVAAVAGAIAYNWIIPNGWSGSSTTNSINVVNSSATGTLQVRAENSCGNSQYQTVSVTVSGTAAPAPDFTINNQEQCLASNSFNFTNTSTAASGTTISSFSWNFGNGTTSSNTSTPTTTYAAAGTYVVSLQVTASNGCVSSVNKQVKVNAAPTGLLSGTTSICSGSSASLSVSLTGQAPWLLNYTGASSPISVSSSPYTLAVSPAGTTTYTLTSISDARCSAAAGNMTGTAIVTVNANLTPSVTITSSDSDNSICGGTTTVTFSSTGLTNQGISPSFQWLKNGVAIAGQTAGTYTATGLQHNDIVSLQMVSNATSCLTTNTVTSNSIQTAVNPGTPASPLAISGDTTQCNNLSNQVYSVASVLNATTYNWTVPTGWTINSGQGTTAISVTTGSAGISNISVTASNGCGTSTEQFLPVKVTSSSAANPISLTSAIGTDGQSPCLNAAITPITYDAVGGSNPRFTGLPAGVSGTYTGSTITISGTPTVAGTSNYVVTLNSSGCDFTRTGSITVRALNSVGEASSTPTLCINTSLPNITHATTGVTGRGTPTNLPAGVTAAWSTNTLTISGTPTQSGIFNYSIPLEGGCGTFSATGLITVTAAKTITLTTSAGSSTQSVCLNNALSSLAYSTTGATGAVFSSLPSGVSGSFSGGTISITGTPSVAGIYNYTATTTGGCGSASASGTITVKGLPSPATISKNNGPLCALFTAEFDVTGIANGILTYNINAGTNSATTLGLNNGNATIVEANITSTQQLNLVSIQDASTGCVTNLSASSIVTIRSENEWTARGNSNNFHTAANWCKNGVPGSSDNVVIKNLGSGSHYPRLTSNNAELAGIQIEDGASLDLNDRKLVINGLISGNGKFIGGSNSSLEFNGTGAVGTLILDQTNAASRTIGTLKINRSANSSVTLGSNAIIPTVDLTNGHLEIGNNDVAITTTINANANSFLKISGTGKVKGSIDGNGPSNSLMFPVGNTNYNPITITNNTGTADSFFVNLLDEVYSSYDPATGAGTLTLTTAPRVRRTWNIDKKQANNTSGGINFVFNWNSDEVSGLITIPALYHFENGGWVKQTGTTTSTATSLTYTGYTSSFSPFSVGDASINLPVTWLSFTATRQTSTVQLNWATASESNTSDFVVEHSSDSQRWAALSTLDAAGNSSTPRFYSYVHQNPFKGGTHNYYRILQRDKDGKYSYSKIVSIIFNEPGADVQVYPNPAEHILHIFLAESQFVRLVNAAGATVWSGFLPAGRTTVPVHTYSKGLYIVITEKKSLPILIL